MTIKFKYVFTQQLQRNGHNLPQHNEDHFGQIWQNVVPMAMVLCSSMFINITCAKLRGYINYTYFQINLGVFQEDPSTVAGTINILSGLHAYVPITPDHNVLKIVCYGDGLSCERHNDAHKARANGATPADRLEGLEPAAQEFHKRMLLMQVNLTEKTGHVFGKHSLY